MRIDRWLTENGKFESRAKAQDAIKGKRVSVNGKLVEKCSFEIEENDDILVEDADFEEYVSRGGSKLACALERFKIDVSGMCAVDIGASTGGFTDCLLKKGANFVYAVDCGNGQLHESLLRDERVRSIENFNARSLSTKITDGKKVDIAVMDVSFISQTKLILPVKSVLKNGGLFITLVKPQFELTKSEIGKNGIVKSEEKRIRALEKVIAFAKENGFELIGYCESTTVGRDGNREYLAYFINRDTE